MAEKVKLADRTHPLYEENLDSWDLYKASVMGGDNFINNENLFTHRLEDSTDYDERLSRAYFLNFCELIPNMINNFIFKENIERPPLTDLEAFRKDVDRKGNSMDDFMKKAGFYSKVYGSVHIFIDLPAPTKAVKTAMDQKKENIYPYASLIYPQQLIDWSLDIDGRFNWIVMKYDHYNDLDPTKEREEFTHYKVITKEKWWIEDEDGAKAKFEDGRPSAGVNPIPGRVPIVTLYHKDTDNLIVGSSLLKDILYINRAILNWCSCLDEQIERQTFSQLIVPDDGSLAEESETGGDPLHRIGTSSVWTFNANASHPPAFISPNVENIQTIWRIIVDHTKEIFRIAGLIGSSEDMYTSSSGKSAQMGFIGVNSTLSDAAKSLQKAENAMSELALAMLNKNIEELDLVKYPDTFDLRDVSTEIDAYFKILERNVSPALNKQIMKDMAKKAVPLAPIAIREEIVSEIDSGDGIVQPVNAQGFGQEGGGDVGNPNTNLGKTFTTNNAKEKQETSHRTEDANVKNNKKV